jgi:hypothetical protein
VHGGDDDDLARVMCAGEPNKEEMDLSVCVVYIWYGVCERERVLYGERAENREQQEQGGQQHHDDGDGGVCFA